MSDQEDEMRAIECRCGHHLEATDDAQLLRLCREHIADHHADMQRTDVQIREPIAADAYEATCSHDGVALGARETRRGAFVAVQAGTGAADQSNLR